MRLSYRTLLAAALLGCAHSDSGLGPPPAPKPPPGVSGAYNGGAVSIPMNGVAPPKPIGRTAPSSAPRTGPNFDVFLVTSTP